MMLIRDKINVFFPMALKIMIVVLTTAAISSTLWAQSRSHDREIVDLSERSNEFPEELRTLPDLPAGFLYKWETQTDLLFFYRSVWDQPTSAVSIYSNGDKPVMEIAPLKDVPEARKVLIYDVGTSKGGEVLLLVTLIDPNRRVTHGFLVYSSKGELLRMIRTNPYHHVRMTLDSEGNIFGFGEQAGAKSSQYGLIVKYSLEGDLLTSFHWRSQFNDNDLDLITGGPAVGQPFMWMEASTVNLYMPSIKTLFKYDVDGNRIGKFSIPSGQGGTLSFAKIIETINIIPMKENTYLIQSRHLTSDVDLSLSSQVRLLVWDTQEGTLMNWSRISSKQYFGRLVGKGKDGSTIFFVPMNNGSLKSGLAKYYQ